MKAQTDFWTTGQSGEALLFNAAGEWNLSELKHIPLPEKIGAAVQRAVIDGSALKALDTAGALRLFECVLTTVKSLEQITLQNFSKKHLSIANLVKQRLTQEKKLAKPLRLNLVQNIGKASLHVAHNVNQILSFLGRANIALFQMIINPRLIRIKELFVQLELAGIDAIPIVALVTFLIGTVIAYLSAAQIERFGVSIFIVDGVSIAMCRELSPIIVAVVIAGRSGSAFTAQIGTMKLNEEVDAIETLGLSPMHVLVIPRIIALVLVMPLLVFVGDVVGIYGGMIVAREYLGLTSTTFIERLQVALPIKHVVIGLLKAPVFASFIALIGTRMGLSVERNARSVGLNTTSTVVQSIVCVIILDAIFAVVFQKLGY